MDYRGFKEKYALRLNEQQAAAVQAREGNVLLLAVPGSGKTTVLVARLGYMILCLGIKAENLLAMTYTVAAARDMKSRFVSFFGEDAAHGLEFRTINSVAAEIIRHYSRHTGAQAFELLSDEGKAAAILGEIYREVSGEFATDGDISSLKTAISYAKNMRLKDEGLEELDKEIKGFPTMFERYKKQMIERRLMDFDDQLGYAYSVLRRYPEILSYYRGQYPYICVDEAQDTSKIQHDIIDLLSQGGNLFMVGDEDQSIYGFRAAYPKALLDFENKHPNARVLLMENNYRSTKQIVEVADRFIRQNSQRREKNMRDTRGDGESIREIELESRRGQYAYLRKIAESCRRETAVLYRDNDCALPLIDQLSREGIGYRCRQLESSFFTNRVVRDVRDIIDFSRDQGNGYVFMRIYYKLGAGISKVLAEAALKNCGDGQSLLECIAESFAAPVWTKKQCRALMSHMENMQSETAGKAVYRIINYMGYGDYLEQRGADRNKCEILQSLADREDCIDGFLSRLDELHAIVKQGTSDPESKFILSTIHSSKGLEYDRVYLMDVIDDILPCSIREDDKKADDILEEERRLFYVAMTRAKNELNIFTFKRRDLTSAFSDFVFDKNAKKEKPRQASVIKAPKASKERLKWDSKDFFNGVRVKHKNFGGGTVLARDGDMVHICFDSGEQKKLLLSISLKLEMLSIEK